MSITMGRLGIEHQTVFGLPPVEFVHFAADLGCGYIAAVLSGNPINPHGYEPFSLRDDAALRQRTIAAMREREVSISLAEGFVVRPGSDMRGYAADLDVLAELGVAMVNTVTMDPDLDRSHDEFGTLAEMASERGMQTTVEFAPSLTIKDLDSALAAVHHVARPPDIVIGLEVPMLSAAQAGEPTEERARRCVQAAHDLLTAAGAADCSPRTER